MLFYKRLMSLLLTEGGKMEKDKKFSYVFILTIFCLGIVAGFVNCYINHEQYKLSGITLTHPIIGNVTMIFVSLIFFLIEDSVLVDAHPLETLGSFMAMGINCGLSLLAALSCCSYIRISAIIGILQTVIFYIPAISRIYKSC